MTRRFATVCLCAAGVGVPSCGVKPGVGQQMPGAVADVGATVDVKQGGLEREAFFWRTFEIDGEWVEFYPSLPELARAADLGLLAKIAGVARVSVPAGSSEDAVFEAEVSVVVLDALQGRPATAPVLTLIMPRVRSAAEAESVVGQLASALPQDPVLLLLRKRASGKFRPVNGYGFWARTMRAPVDAPLNPNAEDAAFYGPYVKQFPRVVDLAASLRK